MSALGRKRTFKGVVVMSALGLQLAVAKLAAHSSAVIELVADCVNPAACRVSWIPSAAAVRAGDDFKQVAVRVFEVDAASAVVVIDLT